MQIAVASVICGDRRTDRLGEILRGGRLWYVILRLWKCMYLFTLVHDHMKYIIVFISNIQRTSPSLSVEVVKLIHVSFAFLTTLTK